MCNLLYSTVHIRSPLQRVEPFLYSLQVSRHIYRSLLTHASLLSHRPFTARMVLSLTYRRPSHVPSDDNSLITTPDRRPSTTESVNSGISASSHGIPEALSFDRIIAGGVCPVRSTIQKCCTDSPSQLTHYSHVQPATS